ncbi:MAG: 4Fe-4S dicluster domain-containing protein [Smithellaceae bacterium]|nr:4Fe-4S dicluster domain-containing protein [Smithellaceae bacterium]
MKEEKQISRRSFLKTTAALTLAGTTGSLALPEKAQAKAGAYTTLIDLTRCDGCQGEAMPKCVEACRLKNRAQFPVPQKPIRDLWPHKKHDDWSDRQGVSDQLTPYNWTTVQRVQVDQEEVFIPRRCMHCDNAPCANLCPFGALNKYKDSAVVINHDLCMGGAKCQDVCPWRIPRRQSGVGIYLKIQPLPAGGGVMYKCDLCHDLIAKGEPPACVSACEKRLGAKRPLYFGTRGEMLAMAENRVKEIGGYLYGKDENGGTATLYVSRVPFEEITARLKEKKDALLMQKVEPRLKETNQLAGGFLLAPLAAAAGAAGLAFLKKRKELKEKNHG